MVRCIGDKELKLRLISEDLTRKAVFASGPPAAPQQLLESRSWSEYQLFRYLDLALPGSLCSQ